MIYLLSDPHGGEAADGLRRYLDIATDADLLIILGDVGLAFSDTEENRAFDRLILESDKKIAFLDGNHENFPYLYSFPEEDFCGGKAHRITENVVHLERGYVYLLGGMRFFAFGGCRSSDGWRSSGKPWYPEEEPTVEELLRAYDSLRRHDYRVDYVLMHKYEQEKDGDCTDLLLLCQFIDKWVSYRHFFAGHFHVHAEMDERHTAVYDRLIPLGKVIP